ncbi:MAG: hypothetical protein DRK00_08680 [Thermoprotei archaeon]|nr:MAG: hypothetical protein DRK00_08680 [Thermoprotei archaeon]
MDSLLLDTTYLLPIFGIKVGLRGYEEVFPKLIEEHAALYSPLSLVEAKWVVLKLARRSPSRRDALLEAYRLGLEALLSDKRLTMTEATSSKIEEVADKLLIEVGLKDYFDRMIYATAACKGAALLTEDEDMLEIGKRWHIRPGEVLKWDDLIKKMKS